MNKKYRYLWLLLQQRIARRSVTNSKYGTEKETLQEILAEMALLESDILLGSNNQPLEEEKKEMPEDRRDRDV